MSKKSHMVKHWMLTHPDSDTIPAFRFTIIAQYRDALSRLIGEAIKIMRTKDYILNSKCEYLNNCLSRISVQETDSERRKRNQLEEEEDRLDDEKLESFIRKKSTPHHTKEEDSHSGDTPHHTKEEDSHSGDDGSDDDVGGNSSSSHQGEETLPSEEDTSLHDVQRSPSSRLDDEGINGAEHQAEVKKKMEPGMMGSHHHHISISRWWHRIENNQHQPGIPGTPSRRKRSTTSSNLAWFSLWWKRMERQGISDYSDQRKSWELNKSSKILSAFLIPNIDQDNKQSEQSKEGTVDEDGSVDKDRSVEVCLLLSRRRKRNFAEDIPASSPAKILKRDNIKLAKIRNNYSTLGAHQPDIQISEGSLTTTYPAADDMKETESWISGWDHQ